MRRLLIAAFTLLSACGGHAGPFRLAPAEPVGLSPTAAPIFYLAPFKDSRRQKELYRGRSTYESVAVEAQGLSLSSQAWQQRPYGGVALLWHRQLAQTLAASGVGIAVAEEPVADEAAALRQAGDAGAKYLVSGALHRGEIGKKGADGLLSTNFTGTYYPMLIQARVRVIEVASGQAALDKPWTYERRFFDPTRLGAPDHQTFPGFFLAGLRDATQRLTGDAELRALAGLAPFTPTPTPTSTALAVPPTPGPTPTAAPTPVPTPDDKPQWVNPKTGKKVDPSWNFDPEDGTPRKEFILRQPTPRPTPARVTAPR